MTCSVAKHRSAHRAPWVAALVVGISSLASGCHRPPNLTPEADRAWTANQVVTRLGEFQQAVIDASTAGKVSTADARMIVTWISGDTKTTPPVTGALDILKTAPSGWQTTLSAGWMRVRPVVASSAALNQWASVVDAMLMGLQ